MPSIEQQVHAYPARLTPDEDGRLVISFRDVPEALTDGADQVEALAEAADALDEAITGRIASGLPVPTPSKARHGEILVPLSPAA